MNEKSTSVASASAIELLKAVGEKTVNLGTVAYDAIVDMRVRDMQTKATTELGWAFRTLEDLTYTYDKCTPEFKARFDGTGKEISPAGYSEGQIAQLKEIKRQIGMFEEAIAEAKTTASFCKINQLMNNPRLAAWKTNEPVS